MRNLRSTAGATLLTLLLAAPLAAELPGAPFVDARQRAATLYFLYDSPARLERYDLDTESWLDAILLPPAPTAFELSETEIYVAFGQTVYAFASDGTGQRFLRNHVEAVRQMHRGGSYLLLVGEHVLSSIDVVDGALLDEFESYYGFRGTSFDGSGLFSNAGYYDNLVKLVLSSGGEIVDQVATPYYYNFEPGSLSRYWAAPDLVADDAGIVYDADTLEYVGSLGGALDDLAVDGTDLVASRGRVLTWYGAELLRRGIVERPSAPIRVFVHAGAAFAVFGAGGDALTIERIPLSAFEQPELSAPPDPEGLDFEPTRILRAAGETVLLLSPEHRAVFRWSAVTEDWLSTVPTYGVPTDIAVSGDGGDLFIAHEGGEITRVALDEPLDPELPFVNAPGEVCGLATPREHLFFCAISSQYGDHFTYDFDGQLTDFEWDRYLSEEYVWSEANGRLYYTRDNVSPNDFLTETVGWDGAIGAEFDSPYHGDYDVAHPLRVSPDGAILLTGPGDVYDAISLTHENLLASTVADADWLGTGLYTVRSDGASSRIQSWSPVFEPLDSRKLPGSPLRLLALDGRLLVVTQWQGRPAFWLRQPDLDGTSLAVAKTDGLAEVSQGGSTTYTITVENLSGAPIGDVLIEDEFPYGLENVAWSCAPSPGATCAAGSQAGDIADLVDLPAGGAVVYTATADVLADVVGVLKNRVSVYAGFAEEAAAVDATVVGEPPIFTSDFDDGTLDAWSNWIVD